MGTLGQAPMETRSFVLPAVFALDRQGTVGKEGKFPRSYGSPRLTSGDSPTTSCLDNPCRASISVCAEGK